MKKRCSSSIINGEYGCGSCYWLRSKKEGGSEKTRELRKKQNMNKLWKKEF